MVEVGSCRHWRAVMPAECTRGLDVRGLLQGAIDWEHAAQNIKRSAISRLNGGQHLQYRGREVVLCVVLCCVVLCCVVVWCGVVSGEQSGEWPNVTVRRPQAS